jgi:hypothetical protein
MRERELRRLFLGLAAAAIPGDFIVAGCGGVTTDSSDHTGLGSTGGEAGSPNFVGRPATQTGGAPQFLGSTGGVPMFLGGGQMGYAPGGTPVYVGSGGYPTYPGSTGGLPVTGGYPNNFGAGGALITGGRAAIDAGPFPIEASTPDAQPIDWCPTNTGVFCQVHCIALTPDAGDPSDCQSLCGPNAGLKTCEWIDLGSQTYARCLPDCTGRRPPGLVESHVVTDGALRGYFEEMARLEAASVPAFRVLGRELRAHGAPRSLLLAARRAAQDEVRHTRMGKLLAERFGGRYVRPEIAKRPLRSIEEIATDNAVEGCVRETFGAMMATWQSRSASDPIVRRIMRRVAVDETRHAALALRVAEWANRQLDAAARHRVRAARRGAAEQVMRELVYEPTPALYAIAGVPRAQDARRLAAVLSERLWS